MSSESRTHLVPKNSHESISVSSSSVGRAAAISRPESNREASAVSSAPGSESHQDANTFANTVPPSRPRYGSLGQYRSEEAYLNDLRAWVESKQYFSPGEVADNGSRTLEGFYGKTTMDEYASRPGLRTRHRKRENKQKHKDQSQRRVTVDVTASSASNKHLGHDVDQHRRKGSIADLLRRQRTR